ERAYYFRFHPPGVKPLRPQVVAKDDGRVEVALGSDLVPPDGRNFELMGIDRPLDRRVIAKVVPTRPGWGELELGRNETLDGGAVAVRTDEKVTASLARPPTRAGGSANVELQLVLPDADTQLLGGRLDAEWQFGEWLRLWAGVTDVLVGATTLREGQVSGEANLRQWGAQAGASLSARWFELGVGPELRQDPHWRADWKVTPIWFMRLGTRDGFHGTWDLSADGDMGLRFQVPARRDVDLLLGHRISQYRTGAGGQEWAITRGVTSGGVRWPLATGTGGPPTLVSVELGLDQTDSHCQTCTNWNWDWGIWNGTGGTERWLVLVGVQPRF
ncbi:MAG: hypothetical protein ACOYOB_18180, partial [Myxococcota bacterium]